MTGETTVTVLHAGMEQIEPDHWVEFVFDMPGCFSSGKAEAEAVFSVEASVRAFYKWLGEKDGGYPEIDAPIRVEVIETIPCSPSHELPGKWVHGIFEEDYRPLRPWDVDMAVRILEWNRSDLLSVMGRLNADAMRLPQETWKMVEWLTGHIGDSEEWLLNRLGKDPHISDLPGDPISRLAKTREATLRILPEWLDNEEVTTLEEELWTARKVLRRLLWHERDHIHQIAELTGIAIGGY